MQIPAIIGITGNAGKTTTKEMLATILQNQWNIYKSLKNGNSAYFLKQHAKELDNAYHAFVLEYGMRYAGDLTQLCNIVQPNIGIVTNVGYSHIGNFNGDLNAVAAAKSEFIQGMQNASKLFLNADDENSKLLDTKNFKGEIIYVSISTNSSYQAYDVSTSEDGIEFKMKFDHVEWHFHLPILGKHNVYNALFAIAVSHQLGVSPLNIKNTLAKFKPVFLRLNLYQYPGYQLLDDTHNASPESVIAAIDILCEIGHAENIFIFSKSHDQENCHDAWVNIGKYIVSKKITCIYTFGITMSDTARQLSQAAIAAGFPPANIVHFNTIPALYTHLQKHIKINTTCLIKGGKLYKLVHFLRLFPFKPAFNLVT